MRMRLRQFRQDRRGSVAVISAGTTIAIMGFAALSVDLGKVSVDRRRAQSVTDLAAIAAASDMARAARAATATTARNALPDGTTVGVETGLYTPDASVPAAHRFRPMTGPGANAARVTLDTESEFLFARMLTGQRAMAIRTTATAATTSFAAFAIGSRLLALDGGLLNNLLGALLGTSASLSVMDYQALADARIDLFQFLPALARQTRIEAATYDQLLASNVKLVDVVGAMAASTLGPAGAPTTASRALGQIALGLRGTTTTMPLSSLVNVGPYGAIPVGQAPAAGVAVSALDLATAAAQIANGARQVEVALGANLPGIASASLKLAIGERPVGTSWVTVSAIGASVHTAQTRLILTARLLGTGNIASVNLPLYVEIASATARLTAIQCGFPDASFSTMTLGVTPAVVDAWIGDVPAAQFINFRTPPTATPAALVDTLLLKVRGRAHATVTNMAPQPVTFSMAEIARRTKKTVGTTDFTRSLLMRLIADLSLDVELLGLGLGLPGAVEGTVVGIVNTATPSLDQLINQVLATLGIGLGQADVWGLGLRCDGAVLVH
ncbi:MAG: hypothetical protein JNK84_20825 [Phreatobacter sp.]|uniref:pilus assembly protein TadG-related protein n=1 Tax=Phreatobacter sp. TaxID=1966341 RepID=UPI001A389F9F|nr:pilus assembly protein TadG-related protein [Phreatobacter sp.]MBL8571528.1 hypothetical protein [Phreatobacter sp.]